MRGNLQSITIPNGPTIESTEPGENASVGTQETHAAGHDYGDISSGFSRTENRQSPSDSSSTLTHTSKAVMPFSSAHDVAWIDADAIVPYMQYEIVIVR
jgi:hypothetical protein